MDAHNKVSVRIYGQEYTITGTSPPDQIVKVANFVDDKMHRIAAAIPSCSVASLAVLTAVNLTDEYFKLKRMVDEISKSSGKHEKEIQKYEKLLEEAKESLDVLKEKEAITAKGNELLRAKLEDEELKAEALKSKNKEMKNAYNALKKKNEKLNHRLEEQIETVGSSDEEVKILEARLAELKKECEALQGKNEKLMERLGAQEESSEINHHEVKTLEEKLKEMETAFFDLQMENIQLKGELDRYKKIVE
ncbi:MAG: cell division protein ZapA [Anaerovoracaceae bacterium]